MSMRASQRARGTSVQGIGPGGGISIIGELGLLVCASWIAAEYSIEINVTFALLVAIRALGIVYDANIPPTLWALV